MLKPYSFMVTCLMLASSLSSALEFNPSSGPIFTQEPEDVMVIGNSSTFTLTCTAKGDPQPTYQWFARLANNYRMDPLIPTDWLEIEGGTVIIHMDKLEDNEALNGAIFQCTAINLHGKVLSRLVRVAYRPYFERSLLFQESKTRTALDSVYFTCPFDNPFLAVRYQWYKDYDVNNIVHQDTDPRVFSAIDGNLYITRLAPEDSGTYHCIATITDLGSDARLVGNEADLTQRNFDGVSLTVLPISFGRNSTSLPYFRYIRNSFPPVPRLFENVTLQCYADEEHAIPFRYQWLRKDKQGNTLPFPVGHVLKDNNRTLILTYLHKEDEGDYECVVEGEYGSVSRTLGLKVYGKPYFRWPMNKRVVANEGMLYLKCYPSGSPTPTVKWYRDGVVLPGETQTTLNLTFAYVGLYSGMYQCGALNRMGASFDTRQISMQNVYGAETAGKATSQKGAHVTIVAMMMTMAYIVS